MYTICRPTAAFYEYLIEVVIAPHLTTTAKKQLLCYPMFGLAQGAFIGDIMYSTS